MIIVALVLLQNVFGLSFLLDGNVVKFSHAGSTPHRGLDSDDKLSACRCSAAASWFKHHNIFDVNDCSRPMWGTYRPGFYFGNETTSYDTSSFYSIISFKCFILIPQTGKFDSLFHFI